MLEIKRYNEEYRNVWDQFIETSKNGFFMFKRGYMDYHQDRFIDHSLMFYKNDQLIAVLPSNQVENQLHSHGGLTFGGLIAGNKMDAVTAIEVFQSLIDYATTQQFEHIIYKSIPYIYHVLPSQEDLYALFRVNANLFRRDIGSVIDLSTSYSFTKGTKSNLSKARKNNIRVEPSSDFKVFMQIEEQLLKKKYGVAPTHTLEEVELLASRFSKEIQLYLAYKEKECLGGVITFETSTVVHTQYIGITDEGKETGALDAIINFLLNNIKVTIRYFSFGSSTTDGGRKLNEGLIRSKESFGARAIALDFYKIDICDL